MPCVFAYDFKDLILTLPLESEFKVETNLEQTSNSSSAATPEPEPGPEDVQSPRSVSVDVDCESKKNLVHDLLPLGSTCCGEDLQAAGVKLDVLLCQFWDEAQEKGLFRYKHQKLPFKIITGKFNFIAQLNTDRAEKRRKPQVIQTVNQSYDHQQFNFNKVNPEEIILQIKPWWSVCGQMKKLESEVTDDVANNDVDLSNTGTDNNGFCCGSTSTPALDSGCTNPPQTHDDLLNSDESCHKILINVSPLEYGNVLLVPFLPLNLPQVITQDSLRIAVEYLLLSRSRNFRVGFNSLCAYASVNHCHFHSYYLSHRLYLEHAKVKEVKGRCMELCDSDYPAPGFVFILTSADLENEHGFISFIEEVYKFISLLQVNELPHNVYITRGASPNNSNLEQFDAVRIFVWARSPSFGDKVCDAFNPALCELAGHFPIKTQENYERITEEFIVTELRQITLESFHKVRSQIEQLYC